MIVKPTTRFKKDYKRYKHDVEKIKLLESIVKLLENEQEIPSKFKPHPLTGNYHGCMECHVGNDFLLIWRNPEDNIIYLVRLGSHSELF